MMKNLKVGALAARVGITVRTLHHWDEIGLLVPSHRTDAGHRGYGTEDIVRLQHIMSLRGLGLSLEEIGRVLDDPRASIVDAVERQLERIDSSLRELSRLRDRLERVRELAGNTDETAIEAFLDAIQESVKVEKYYTEAQRNELEARAAELGKEGLRQAERDWAEVIAAFKEARSSGVDAADPTLDPWVEKWNTLIQAFTGGNPGIEQSLGRLYQEEGSERASRGMLDAEVMAYAQEAIGLRREKRAQ